VAGACCAEADDAAASSKSAAKHTHTHERIALMR